MKPNRFEEDDIVKWTEQAKEGMPLSTHNKDMRVIEVDGFNILVEGEKGFVNHEWFERVNPTKLQIIVDAYQESTEQFVGLAKELIKVREEKEEAIKLLTEFVDETKKYIDSPEGHGCTWGINARTYEQAKALIGNSTL